MNESEFIDEAIAAGFTKERAWFMLQFLRRPVETCWKHIEPGLIGAKNAGK